MLGLGDLMKIEATVNSLVFSPLDNFRGSKLCVRWRTSHLHLLDKKNIKPIFMTSSKMTSGPCENPFLSFEWSYTKVYEKG